VLIVNVADLERIGEATVNAEVLVKRGVIRSAKPRLKVLGNGELKTAVTVRAHAFSEAARQKIEAAGGKVEVIEIPKRPKRYKKKEKTKA